MYTANTFYLFISHFLETQDFNESDFNYFNFMAIPRPIMCLLRNDDVY